MIALKPIEALPEPTPEEHLAAELRWLRLLLRRLVSPGAGSSRADAALGPDDLGAFIEGPKAKHPMDAAIEQAGSAVEAMLDRDPGLPFASLSSRVGLRGATRRLLALAYTCASDPWAARAVDLAASEGPGRAADLAFFLRMLAASHEEIDEVLGMLHVTAPLRRHGLVELRGAASGGGWPALRGCELLLPADLVAHLRGVKVGGEAAGIGLKEAARSWGSLHLPLATARQLMALSGTLTGTRLVLWGPDRSGAADVAEALAASQGRHIVSAAHSSAGDELLDVGGGDDVVAEDVDLLRRDLLLERDEVDERDEQRRRHQQLAPEEVLVRARAFGAFGPGHCAAMRGEH